MGCPSITYQSAPLNGSSIKHRQELLVAQKSSARNGNGRTPICAKISSECKIPTGGAAAIDSENTYCHSLRTTTKGSPRAVRRHSKIVPSIPGQR